MFCVTSLENEAGGCSMDLLPLGPGQTDRSARRRCVQQDAESSFISRCQLLLMFVSQFTFWHSQLLRYMM